MENSIIKNSCKKINLNFYKQTDVLKIAKELLGLYLFTKITGKLTGGKIVETEAYAGISDKASHSFSGKKTPRNKAMYQTGGIVYIYLCYGIHHLFNVVTSKKEDPQAVLIRAIEPTHGIDIMLKRRSLEKISYKLTAGPGSLTRALGLTMKENGQSLINSNIWIEKPFNQKVFLKNEILASPRVGVAYAGKDALLPWRFRIKNNPWCSKAK